MEQFFKTVLTFAVLIAVLFGLYFFSDWFSKTTGYVFGESEKMDLAICLKNKGAVFYSSSTCPECDKQLELLGKDASKLLNIVICSNADECPAGGVPAWEIGGQTHYGYKELSELVGISGCDVK